MNPRAFAVVSAAMSLCALAVTGCPDGASDAGAAPRADAADDAVRGLRDDAGADATGDAPPPHAPLPSVPSAGGPVLDPVDLVTITFAGDPHDGTVAAFGDAALASTWLAKVGPEYDVRGGTHTHVVLPETPPARASSAESEARLSAWLDAGRLPGGATKSPTNRLYMLVYPPTTLISDGSPGADCASQKNTEVFETDERVEGRCLRARRPRDGGARHVARERR